LISVHEVGFKIGLIYQETEKPVRLVPNPSESEDCSIIDVEDYKATSDVPMFVQHTEAMLEEIYRMVFSAPLLSLKMFGWNGIKVLISCRR
jgi:hypothetical protein